MALSLDLRVFWWKQIWQMTNCLNILNARAKSETDKKNYPFSLCLLWSVIALICTWISFCDSFVQFSENKVHPITSDERERRCHLVFGVCLKEIQFNSLSISCCWSLYGLRNNNFHFAIAFTPFRLDDITRCYKSFFSPLSPSPHLPFAKFLQFHALCHTVDASYASKDSTFSIKQLILRLLTSHLFACDFGPPLFWCWFSLSLSLSLSFSPSSPTTRVSWVTFQFCTSERSNDDARRAQRGAKGEGKNWQRGWIFFLQIT